MRAIPGKTAWGLLFLTLVAGCSHSPVDIPDFELTGVWTGAWTDALVLDSSGAPMTGAFTLQIDPDGQSTASGTISYSDSEGAEYESHLDLSLIAYYDGGVFGTGTYTVLGPDTLLVLSGDVVGQLEPTRGGTGSLSTPFLGFNVHFDWKVDAP